MKIKHYYFLVALPFIVFLLIFNSNCLAQQTEVSKQKPDAETAKFFEDLNAKIPSIQTDKFKFVTKKIDDCNTISEVYDKKTGQQVMEITRDFCGFHIKPIGNYKISDETLAEVKAQEMIMVTINDTMVAKNGDVILVGSEGIVYEWYKDGEKVDNDPPFRFVDELPEFPGGMEAMYNFLQINLNYPQEAMDNKLEGQVFIEFIVEKDGSISNAKILHSAEPKGIKKPYNKTITDAIEALNAEALRVVNKMPNWKPGKNKGKEVRCFYQIPIRFTVN